MKIPSYEPQVRAAANATTEDQAQRQYVATIAALRTSCFLDNFQFRPLDCRVLGAGVKTEMQRIRQHCRQLADLQRDTRDLGTLRVFRADRHHIAGDAAFVLSANPRQLFADQHVDNTLSAESGVQHHHARRLLGYFADNGRMFSRRMRAHRRQYPVRVRARHNRYQLAFVGEIKRVESENFAGTFHFLAQRQRGLADTDRNVGALRELIEHGRHTAAGRIAQTVDVWADRQHRRNQ